MPRESNCWTAIVSLGLALVAGEIGAQPAQTAEPANQPPPGGAPAPADTTSAPPASALPPITTAVPPPAPPAAAPPAGAYPYRGQPYGPPPYGAPPQAPPGYPGAWGYPPAAQPPPLPATIPYREGRQPPPGYTLETQSIRGLWLSGIITFGAPWFMSAVGAGILLDEEKEDVAPLFAPVLGPFIAIGTLATDSPGTTLLMVDGLAQAAGVGLLIAGLTAERKVWVRDYFSLSAVPLVSAHGSGLSLTGEM